VCHCVLFYLYFIFDNINENISNFASFKWWLKLDSYWVRFHHNYGVHLEEFDRFSKKKKNTLKSENYIETDQICQ
jgi:hypothetical protein